AGSKYVTEGPRVYGSISSGRDTNIATTLTVTNTGSPSDGPAAGQAPPVVGPALRLWLETPPGKRLDAAVINQEAVLRVGLEGDSMALPELDLQLEADGAGVEWSEGTRRPLRLRPGAAPRLPRWLVLPLEAGPLTLRVLVLRDTALVQQL